MKIAFLCKRKYMSKDVILERYARLYEIPNQLSLLGHEVECFCLSYQNHDEGLWDETNSEKKLKWYSKSYKGLKKTLLWSYPLFLIDQLKTFKPDLIIAASDIPHIIIASWVAKKLDCPFIADLYDNFEAYGQAKIPGLKFLFHKALDSAQLISTTSISLAEKIKTEHPKVPNIFPMPSVINKELFKTGDQVAARKELNLPLEKKLIGTAGSLTRSKGIDDLFHAWDMIKKQNSNIDLVLAGPIEISSPLLQDDRIIYLGLLPHEQIATLFQALEIGILCIPKDEFGQYCFPQKAYEMLACDLFILSSSIGDMVKLLPNEQLFDSSEELAKLIVSHTENVEKLDVSILDWKQVITLFHEEIFHTVQFKK